jgi:ADP-dependent NAD(P)H-hydrate dehydratase / NAD(P)H-hydrate epimerase
MIELLSNDEMASADRMAEEAGTPSLTLMENAGRAVADAVSGEFPNAGCVAVLCGPGNNGGDGFVCARILRERGFQIQLGLLGTVEKLKGDAAIMAGEWRGEIAPLSADVLAGADIVVDALFGAGLTRPLEGAAAKLADAVNASGLPVIAVDIPSGTDGDTGAIEGEAILADFTVTFFRRKPGHLLLPGRIHCGEVVVADIGIPATVLQTIQPKALANEPELWLSDFPWPQLDGHKYDRGHAVVVSGPLYSTGAARLAARGALRAGAGLVTVASPQDALAVNAAQLTAIMVREVPDANALTDFLSDSRKNAILLGPGMGMGEGSCDLVLAALESEASCVLDADALTTFSNQPERLFDAIKAREAPVVLTPHDGEFARLFGNVAADSRLAKARAGAARSGSIVLLKGADTVIAAPDGHAAINETGSPWLATAGTGDVLAGIVLGLLAQGMPAFDGACAGVWLHGEAAALYGPGLIAEDIPEMLPDVFEDLTDEDSD